jgi:hypothetical protein
MVEAEGVKEVACRAVTAARVLTKTVGLQLGHSFRMSPFRKPTK